MSRVKTITLAALVSAMLASISTTVFAADKQYTVEVNSAINGTDTAIEYLLKSIDGEIVSRKSGSSGKISFDPLTFDSEDSSSHFYTITQNNVGTAGLTYDNKTVYVRIVPNRDLVAYQDDTTYKYKNDGSGPHPYHATEEELQGQAYAVFDSKTKTLTFFRDEEGKYTDGYAERIIEDGETYYKQYFTDFELVNKDHPGYYGSVKPSWTYGCNKNVEFQNPYYYHRCTVADDTEKIVFKDAIRPEGAMYDWFYLFKNVTSADIAKLDTSLVTSMVYFFYGATKLTDIDITKLDFKKASETVATSNEQSFNHFMKQARLQELDFTNYDLAKMEGKYPLGEAFLGSDLRYLNTTNLYASGSSSEFAENSCLERLVVGNGFSFYRTSTALDTENYNGTTIYNTAGWLKIETGRIDRAYNMIPYNNGTFVGDPNPNAAGNYVRPTCNTTPPVFTSYYQKPADASDDESRKEANVKNPDTVDSIAISAAAFAISGMIAFVIFRTKRR